MSEKQLISVELPRNWEEIDPDHMYHILDKFTFFSDNVTQAEHDIVANLCVALEQFTGKEIKYENPSPSGDPFYDNQDNVREIKSRIKEMKNEH